MRIKRISERFFRYVTPGNVAVVTTTSIAALGAMSGIKLKKESNFAKIHTHDEVTKASEFNRTDIKQKH